VDIQFFSTPFVEEAVFAPTYMILVPFLKNQMAVAVWIILGLLFYSIGLFVYFCASTIPYIMLYLQIPFPVLMKSSNKVLTLLKVGLIRPGAVVHACNSSTWEAKTGGLQIKASLGYILSFLNN
jgi:hypothetical protein